MNTFIQNFVPNSKKPNIGSMSLQQLRSVLRADIATYVAETRRAAGPPNMENFFFDRLLADRQCAQGLLVLIGYLLCARPFPAEDQGLPNLPPSILTAARAIQMTHVYAEHTFGELPSRAQPAGARPRLQADSLSLHAGLHAAEIVLANLDAPSELRLKAVSITNRALLVRTHGENARLKATAKLTLAEQNLLATGQQFAEAEQNMIATELALNPLHVGMVLADADCAATDAITPFALALGRSMLQADGPTRFSANQPKPVLNEDRDGWNQMAVRLLEQFTAEQARIAHDL